MVFPGLSRNFSGQTQIYPKCIKRFAAAAYQRQYQAAQEPGAGFHQAQTQPPGPRRDRLPGRNRIRRNPEPEQDQAPGRNRISGNQGPQWDQAPGSARRLHPAPDLPLPPYYISADPQRNRTYPFWHRQSAAYNFWSHILPSEE